MHVCESTYSLDNDIDMEVFAKWKIEKSGFLRSKATFKNDLDWSALPVFKSSKREGMASQEC